MENAALACTLAGRAMLLFGFSDHGLSWKGLCFSLALAEALWYLLSPTYLTRVICGLAGFFFINAALWDRALGSPYWVSGLLSGALAMFVWPFAPRENEESWEKDWKPLGTAAALTLSAWPFYLESFGSAWPVPFWPCWLGLPFAKKAKTDLKG